MKPPTFLSFQFLRGPAFRWLVSGWMRCGCKFCGYLLCFCLLCGCQPSAPDSKSVALGAPPSTRAETTPVPGNSSAVAPVAQLPVVRIADRAELDQLIATHRGKVVLVDFWATWCGPCVQQFPHTVELSQANPAHLAVISVSMDEPEDLARVQKFLLEREAVFDHLLSKYGVGLEGFKAFDITDGSIPHYKIYDREGQLQHSVQDSRELAALLDGLMTKSP